MSQHGCRAIAWALDAINKKVLVLLLACVVLSARFASFGVCGEPTYDSRLEVKPLTGMLDTLDVTVDDRMIELFRCDFTARNLSELNFRILAIKDQNVIEIGKATNRLLGSADKTVDGTCYIAIAPSKTGSPDQLLSMGIATTTSRTHSAVNSLNLSPQFTYWRGAQRSKIATLSPGEEVLIWGAYYKKGKPKNLQELTSEKDPFGLMDPSKIIEAAKTLQDSTLVMAVMSCAK